MLQTAGKTWAKGKKVRQIETGIGIKRDRDCEAAGNTYANRNKSDAIWSAFISFSYAIFKMSLIVVAVSRNKPLLDYTHTHAYTHMYTQQQSVDS